MYCTKPEAKVGFKYNTNGLRTQRKHFAADSSVITTDYTLHGELITHLTKRVLDLDGAETSEELHFFYDAQSRPAFVEYEGTMYRYIHNLQGDIVAIVDPTGNPVVEYKYDAWGRQFYKIGSMSNSLGSLNPFKYRAYAYDAEMKLYYLRSRYYNPGIAKFANGDCILPHAILMTNNYAYCCNNPIVKIDNSGCAGYSVYLNTYTDNRYENPYGHYDISILSADMNNKVTYSFCDKSKSVDILTISYGPTSKNDSTALLTFFDGYNSKAVPTAQYKLFDDLSQAELNAFIEWLSREFIDVSTMNENERMQKFNVTHADFSVYSIDNKKYCGSATAKLIINMRQYETAPISSLASRVLGLALFLMLEPQYVTENGNASNVFNALNKIFGGG